MPSTTQKPRQMHSFGSGTIPSGDQSDHAGPFPSWKVQRLLFRGADTYFSHRFVFSTHRVSANNTIIYGAMGFLSHWQGSYITIPDQRLMTVVLTGHTICDTIQKRLPDRVGATFRWHNWIWTPKGGWAILKNCKDGGALLLDTEYALKQYNQSGAQGFPCVLRSLRINPCHRCVELL